MHGGKMNEQITNRILTELDLLVLFHYGETLWDKKEDGEILEGLIGGVKTKVKQKINKILNEFLSPLYKVKKEQEKKINRLQILLYNCIVLLEEYTTFNLKEEITITKKEYQELIKEMEG